MQQILKFNIDMFDVRMRTSISVVNDSSLVRSLQIRKNLSLDNVATITFQKSRAYDLLDIEKILKLYNYVKIRLELRTYNPDNLTKDNKGNLVGEVFYFSGFIQTITKSTNFSSNPEATVAITVSDYANLLKTTFYTKNLTFLEILNQAVPEFRMVNLTEYLGAESAALLNDLYSPSQLGFIFFAFLYFKFMYRLLYEDDGSDKTTAPPDSVKIFKRFKIYMPFGLDIGDSEKSMFNGQEQSLTIYKQLQGVALDLFKYIYPEPIFEFSTFETEESVILQIRLTPFMKFDRPVSSPQNVRIEGTGEKFLNQYKQVESQELTFIPQSYNVIERFDFGFNRINSIKAKTGRYPAALLRDHINEDKGTKSNPKRGRILSRIQKAIGESKHINADDLIASDDESHLITQKFFEPKLIDTRYLETLNMTRSAQSVVNVIWTTPTTDTAIMKMSGRELIYAYLEQRLNEIGGADKFGNYILQQFNPNFNPNPMFLMNYRNVLPGEFLPGDINYFGFREFEIKWNYLSIHYSTVGYILGAVDKNVLIEARKKSEDKNIIRTIDDAINSKVNSDDITRNKSKKTEKERSFPFDQFSYEGGAGYKYVMNEYGKPRQTSRMFWQLKPVKNKASAIDVARKEQLLSDALDRYSRDSELGLGLLDKKKIQNADTIIKLIQYGREQDAKLMGGFVSKINSVVAEAYRENEHLYDCNIIKPIDLAFLPGMIVESSNDSIRAQSPYLKGYVTGVSHNIDFNAAVMKTNINISRAASDDSGVVSKFFGET